MGESLQERWPDDVQFWVCIGADAGSPPGKCRISGWSAPRVGWRRSESEKQRPGDELSSDRISERLDLVTIKVAIGSDHAGFKYKEQIKSFLLELGHNVKDFGTNSEEPVDYPLFIRPVAEAVARGEFERGIVLGGSGNGEAIVANRVRGIRCALCWNLESACLARQHNDAKLLSLGQRLISLETALDIVRIWLDTPFEGGRHARRIALIDAPAKTAA